MGWASHKIDGKPAEIFEPATRRGAVIFLHNARCQSLSFSKNYTQLLEEHGLACVCPFGGATWWADRVLPTYDPARSSVKYVLDAVVPFAIEKWQLGPRSLGLLGISMGGQGVLRLAFQHPELFPVVAAVAPAIEHHEFFGQGSGLDQLYDSKEQCRQDTVPMHLNPSAVPPHIFFAVDPSDENWIRGADRLHEKMTALGVAHQCDLETKAGGHGWSYFDAMARPAVEFLSRGLAVEARRLI